MSLFGSMMGDVEDDPFFGSHMRHMRQMNNMMNSLFADPFGMLGGGPLAIAGAGPRHPAVMMPFMPQMPPMNRLFAGHMPDLDGHMSAGASYSSSTVVMSNGPHGKPQVYSSSSSTKIGPNGIKETRKTLQDSRTGTKKMSIGHHIGERAHLIEREQNVYSGDAEERQEFINIEEEEAEDFNREFETKAGSATAASRMRALPPAPSPQRRSPPRLALPPAPSNTSSDTGSRRHSAHRPAARRPLRTTASPISASPSVREVYGGSHPQPRHRHKHHKAHAHAPPPAHAHAPTRHAPADDEH